MDITLDRSQRDALHAACLLDLSDVDEIELYLRRGEFEEARELTERVVGTATLLRELGWDPDVPGDTFRLRGDPDFLRQVVERLRRQAEESLRDQADWINAGSEHPGLAHGGPSQWREEVQRSVDEDLDTRLACDQVLELLDGQTGTLPAYPARV